MLSLGNKLTLNTQPIYKFVNKYSIDFDGVDDCIVTDGADTVAQPTTYSFWCKSSETGSNIGLFGHGASNQGGFHFNWSSNRPLLYLGNGWFVFWNDTSAQDDGEWHHWVVYADTNNVNNCKLYVDGVLQTVNLLDNSGSLQAYTESLTIGGDKVSGGNYFEGQIDEFAVYDRELTQAEITRMYNTYYSPNRVANGNFSQIGNEEVTNGDFSQIGSELVTNGGFDTDSDWSTTGGWSVGGGKASNNGTEGILRQSNTVQLNTRYKVVFTVSNYVTGDIQIKLAPETQNVTITGDGTYTIYTGGNNSLNDDLQVRGPNSFQGSIDNISVKEVGQDWSFGTGITIENEKAFFNDSAYPQAIEQTNIATIGNQYKVSFTVSDYQSGTVKLRHPFEVSGVQSDGDYVFYGEAASTGITFRGDGVPNNFKLDNISVKEVGQHWTFGTGWSVEDNQLVSVTGTASYTTQSGVGIIGRTYQVIADVDEVSAGQTYLYTGQYGTFYEINSAVFILLV